MNVQPEYQDLPGADLIDQGIEDLHAGEITAEALLVAIGAPRLQDLGFDLPHPLPSEPEHRLFFLLDARGESAHSAFNALRRRLVSFQRGLERRVYRRVGIGPA